MRADRSLPPCGDVDHASWGAPTGQVSAQLPQLMHLSASISYLPSPSALHKNGELADEELDNVSGGGCADPREGCYASRGEVRFKYMIGAVVWATEGEMSSKGVIRGTDIKSQKGKGFNFGYEYYPVYRVGIGLRELSNYREKEFREEDIKLY